jgi:2-polyprenyl-6-methoxyphenol hydroxylase-like FAD-dependent oxidoreductase
VDHQRPGGARHLVGERHRHDLEGPPRQELREPGIFPGILLGAPQHGNFWGLGYDIADWMGLRRELDRLGYHMGELRIVDNEGKRVTGFGTNVFRELTGGRFVTIRRSDLARLLFERASPVAETVFGDAISSLEQDRNGVNVSFEHAVPRRFDLVMELSRRMLKRERRRCSP